MSLSWNPHSIAGTDKMYPINNKKKSIGTLVPLAAQVIIAFPGPNYSYLCLTFVTINICSYCVL